MIPYRIIASGSKGNATIIDDHFMIDCGVPMKALEPYCNRLTVILLTHRHSDHLNKATVRYLANNRPMLRFGCCDFLVPDLLKLGVSNRCIDVLRAGRSSRYSSITVEPFLVTHDVPNVGYKLQMPAGKLFYATDCANLNGIEAKDYDLYLIEGNHKTAEIDAKIAAKKERLEYAYERRAKEMHLSEEAATEWLMKNMGAKSSYVFMHQHHEKGAPCRYQ